MGKGLEITIYDSLTYRPKQHFVVEPNTDDDNIILYLEVSKDESRMGVILGKYLIKDKCEITEIVIYNRERGG